MIASYTYADDQPISMTRGGETYYQTNYRGDVVALTDSAGAVVATYEYDAYGNLLKETGNVENPYRYAGYRYDEETGLYYLQSRYYSPETGRFLTRDKLEGFENEPLTLNKYAYGNNNPVVMVDPDGNAAWALGAVLLYPGAGLSGSRGNCSHSHRNCYWCNDSLREEKSKRKKSDCRKTEREPTLKAR